MDEAGAWGRIAAGAMLVVAMLARGQDLPAAAEGIETITVTARKRSEDAQQVPMALSAADAETITQRGFDTVGDLDRLSPNVQIGFSSSTPTIHIRGVGGGGRQAGFDPRAGVYLDGVYLGAPPGVDSLLLDLDRAEILRGPQGTLFGQNTTSGAISLVSRAPGAGSFLRAAAGNRQSRSLSAAGDLPLRDAPVQIRGALTLAERDGFLRNARRGDESDDLAHAGGRLRLQWQAARNLDLDVSMDLSRQGTHNLGGEPRTNTFGNAPPAQPAPFVVDNNTRERDDRRNAGIAGTLRWTRGDLALTSLSAYRESRRDWTADADRSALDWARFDYDDEYELLSQELRLESTAAGGRLRWLAGAYVLAMDADSGRYVEALPGVGGAPGPIGQITPGDRQRTLPRIDTRSAALFGTLDWRLTERLSLDAGLRLTRTEKDMAFDQVAQTLNRIGIQTIPGYRDDFSETAADPTLGLRLALDDASMAYLRYARGSKSGGFNADLVIAPRARPERFDQETVDSFEAGYKAEWFDRRLRANLALFLADYHDYQVTQSLRSGELVIPTMTNAGRVRTWGPELSLSALPLPGLRLDLDLAWLDAEYEAFEDGGGPGVDYSGNRTENAPRWTLGLAVRYERDLPQPGLGRFYLGLDGDYRGRQYADESNAERFLLRSRSLLDARIGVRRIGGHWEFGLYADNLLDKDYDESFQTGSFGTLSGHRGMPRTWGAVLRYEG